MFDPDLRKNTNKLLELVDDGLVDPIYALEAAVGYMSDDDVGHMCHQNEIFLNGDEEE